MTKIFTAKKNQKKFYIAMPFAEFKKNVNQKRGKKRTEKFNR